jgi:hypothetical protein
VNSNDRQTGNVAKAMIGKAATTSYIGISFDSSNRRTPLSLMSFSVSGVGSGSVPAIRLTYQRKDHTTSAVSIYESKLRDEHVNCILT